MTRITKFGHKRTYLEAGFEGKDGNNNTETSIQKQIFFVPNEDSNKEKRAGKRRPSSGVDEIKESRQDWNTSVEGSKHAKSRTENSNLNKLASERRRLKRIKVRRADTTCLACREKGHIAKDCTQANTALEGDMEAIKASKGRLIGVCYRCGSKRHNLSQCRKPVDPNDPLPFASCFVCSERGHLASTCRRNNGKGIYPNGGSCKICEQTDHLAKDCPLRSKELAGRGATILSKSVEVGADEDDFHVLKRRRDAVQKEEMLFRKIKDEETITDHKSKPKVVVFR